MNKQILKCIIRYILMILIVIHCFIIFGFSAEKGETSASTSAKIAKSILLINKENRNISENELNSKIEEIQIYVRKGAHLSIYMALGVLLMSCATTFKGENAIKFNTTILLSFFYACSDEFHQSFTAR